VKIIVWGLFFTAVAARAQLPLLHSRFQLAEPGAWADYSLSGVNSSGLNAFYLAAVGEETLEGKRHLWCEWTTAAGGDSNTVKLLIPADSVFNLKVKRLIVKQAGQQALEIPFGGLVLESLMGQQSALGIDLEDMPSSIEKATRAGLRIEDLGKSTRKIAGKTVETNHFRLTEKNGQVIDLWLSPTVPFFSLVRLSGAGLEVNLSDWGNTGALSRIGEDYRSLDLKNIMEGLRQLK